VCRRKRCDDGCAVPTDRLFRTPCWGRGGRLLKASEDCWWGQGDRLLGPGRVEARQSSTTTTIGSTATTTTTTVGFAATTTTRGRSPPGAPAVATTTAAAAKGAVTSLPGSLEGLGPQVSATPFSINLFIMSTGLNPSFSCQGFLPLCSQGHASPASGCYRRDSATGPPCSRWGSGSGGANAKRHHSGGGSPNCPDCRSLNNGDAVEYIVGSGRGGPNCARPRHRGRRGGASSSIPPPTPEETEVIFGRQLWSGAEPEAASVPLPRVLSRAHQALHENEAAILLEWEALEVEHQRLSDWRTQLEERTKAASSQFASERSELERDCKDYKKDL
jgi:hypothetical protein